MGRTPWSARDALVPPKPTTFRKFATSLRSIEDLIDTGKSNGLTNWSLTSAPFESTRSRREYIARDLEALEVSIDPEVLKVIDDGRAQIKRG
jgi:hypothetical protein